MPYWFVLKMRRVTMIFNNPWLVTIIGGILGGIIVGIILYYLFEFKKEKILSHNREVLIDNADKLFDNKIIEEALHIYVGVLNEINQKNIHIFIHD